MNKEDFKLMLEHYLTVEVEHSTEVCLSGTRITTTVVFKFGGTEITEASDVAVVDTYPPGEYCDE